MKLLTIATALGFSLLISVTNLAANTIFLHTGANDPATEGWTANIGPNVIVGPVFNDAGTGLDAWVVDDNGTAIGDAGGYSGLLTTGQVADSLAFGWKLTTSIRIVDFPDPGPGDPTIGYDASPFVSFRDGSTAFQIHFGAQADGDPTVFVPSGTIPGTTGSSFALEGGGTGYHLYELLFTPTGGLDLFIDGIERLSNLATASATGLASVSWGAGSSCCTGQGNFNLVKFETFVPVPGAFWLFGSGLIGLAGMANRKKIS